MIHYAAIHHLFHSKKSVSITFTYTALLKFSFRTIPRARWKGGVQASHLSVSQQDTKVATFRSGLSITTHLPSNWFAYLSRPFLLWDCERRPTYLKWHLYLNNNRVTQLFHQQDQIKYSDKQQLLIGLTSNSSNLACVNPLFVWNLGACSKASHIYL